MWVLVFVTEEFSNLENFTGNITKILYSSLHRVLSTYVFWIKNKTCITKFSAFQKISTPEKLKINKTQKLKPETKVLSPIHLNPCLFSLKLPPSPHQKESQKTP